jgi:arabinose-5-phosphate isomerase
MDKYIEPAIHSLKTEIKGLQSVLDNSLNNTFVELIKAILKTKGRIVVSGMGKSSYIAHKVAATLASTGTAAFFIHPAESSHGDLGMISKDDTVILLSDSGGTRELQDIITYCKRFSIPLIGITRKKDSILYETADIKVCMERVEETNPVNSPTTSGIMMLAYFDAVVTTLISLRKFNQDNYKVFHPGGKLGAALLKVEEVMQTENNIPLIDENATMEQVLDEMTAKELGCVGILNNKKKLIGIITDGDLKRRIKQFNGNIMDKKAKELMSSNPLNIEKDSFAVDAVHLMRAGGAKYIQVLFVVDSEKHCKADECDVVGIIHIQDCLKKGVI